MAKRLQAALLCSLLLCLTAASSAAEYSIIKTIPVGGEGGWDYATIDDKGETLYLPRTNHTMVVDVATGKTLGDIPNIGLGHGVALAPAVNRGFSTDGKKACVVVFDLKTYETLGSVPAAIDADGIILDPATQRICVACGDAGSLVVIPQDVDPKNGKPEAAIELGGKPEFLAADGQGKVYVNLTDKGEVVGVDTKSLKVVSRWPTAPGARATGMSIDREKGRLYIGCRNKHLIVMSTTDGAILGDLAIGSGVDATQFDAGVGLASCSDGTLWVVSETSPSKFEVVQTLKTMNGARTMAVDHATGKLYLPCAEMAPVTETNRRPTPVPGSFKVLVVGRGQ